MTLAYQLPDIANDQLLQKPQGAWALRTAIGNRIMEVWGNRYESDTSLDHYINIVWPNDPVPPPERAGKPDPWIDVVLYHVDTFIVEMGSDKVQKRTLGILRGNVNVPLKQLDVQARRIAETFADIFRQKQTLPDNYSGEVNEAGDRSNATGIITFREPVVATAGFEGEKRAEGLSGVEVGSYHATFCEIPYQYDFVT